MAAKIGILGESTATATGITTIYTVPVDKAARVNILFVVEGHATDNMVYGLLIGSPNVEQIIRKRIGGDVDTWSGALPASTPDPALSILAVNAGLGEATAQIDLDDNAVGNTNEWWIAPEAQVYFLSAGDTVRVQISNAIAAANLIQVHGVEDDV